MISFDEIKGGACEKGDVILRACEGETLEYAEEIISSFYSMAESEDVGVALEFSHGCVLVRIESDGEYVFVYPIALDGDADEDGALLEIARYSVKELLPLCFTDVPREEISRLSRLFSRMDARAYDDDDDCFFVRIINELQNYEKKSAAFSAGEVTLDEITEEDLADYARLCSDAELNRYWGYDVFADNPSGDADYFLKVARSERERGVALALAVRREGKFVGEGVIYGFDYKGSAELGVRILPELQGVGIGSRAMAALISLSASMGLREARAEVMAENTASLRMMDKLMPREKEDGGRVFYKLAFASE